MELEDLDLRKRFNSGKYILGALFIFALILISFFLITYFSLQVGNTSEFDPSLKEFFIRNKYTSYLNPIYVILIQLILDWGSFICVLSIGVALLFLYVIHKKAFLIPYALAFVGISMINVFHFLSSQFEVFSKIPYTWDTLTWWESRIFFVLALALAPLVNRLIEKTKPITDAPTIFFGLLAYFVMSVLFIYFSVAIQPQLISSALDFLPFQQHLFFPIVLCIFLVLPALYFEYKKHPCFFTSLLLVSLIPFCLNEFYTIFYPSPNYYTSFNLAHVLKFLTFIFPFTGVIIDTRLLFCKIELAVDKAQRNIESKNSFISALSNHLSAPLKRTLSRLQNLFNEREGSLNEKQKLLIGTLVNSTLKLSDFTSEIIDLSKIESGSVFYNPEDFDLSSAIQETVNAFIPQAEQKKLHLEYKAPQGSKPITSDLTRVKQILSEILKNALRFTFEGQIILTLEEDERSYFIKIQDTGIGIAQEKLTKMFSPFYQIEVKDHSKHFGVGLSLALKFAKAMNGDISLQSQEGVGSTFTITLLKYLISRGDEYHP